MNPLLLVTLYCFLSTVSRQNLFRVTTQPTFLSQEASLNLSLASSPNDNDALEKSVDTIVRGNVTILDHNEHYLVVEKTPSVICHHSEWARSRSRQEVPMLQRVRQATGGFRRVNLIHRLDRGCSGCLLMTWSDKFDNDNQDKENESIINRRHGRNATRILNEAMQAPTTVKTYVALVRGEGMLHGRDFRQEGWFPVDRPITNERGKVANATTLFRFIAGQDNGGGAIDRPRASIVLCRPATGRWHQIRKHLNGLSHPILGDSTHGNSKINREYRQRYDLLAERTCLHLARIDMNEPTAVTPQGLHVVCPLAPDMRNMLQKHMPDLLERALPVLQQEGILLDAPVDADSKSTILPFEVALTSFTTSRGKVASERSNASGA